MSAPGGWLTISLRPVSNTPDRPGPRRTPPKNSTLYLSLGVVVGIFVVGILLWLPHSTDSATTGMTSLGTALAGGSVVAAAILLIQLTWDRRVREQEQSLKETAEEEQRVRQEHFHIEDQERAARFAKEEIERRERERQWNDKLIQATDRHDTRIARLLLSILAQTGLKGADLRDVDLSGIHLAGLNLTSANLLGAKLIASNLRGTKLSGARLSLANLVDADLDGADLSNAILSRTRLEGASLARCILTGADLSDAEIDDRTVFREAIADSETRWPAEGFDPGAAGVILN